MPAPVPYSEIRKRTGLSYGSIAVYLRRAKQKLGLAHLTDKQIAHRIRRGWRRAAESQSNPPCASAECRADFIALFGE